MSTAKKVFYGIFGAGLIFGLLVGLINFIMPEATSVSLNGENVEGMTALWASVLAGGIPGIVFGLIGAGITALFTRKKKSDE